MGKEGDPDVYRADVLTAYPYFAQLLQTATLESVHDSLTGVIARPYMLQFVRDLIERKVPFTLAIIDLDNFKGINDGYGHQAGDQVLSRVSEDLREFVGRDGVVGRFGGDEFLIAYFKSVDYDEVHDFFMRMYHSGRVFRKNISFDDVSLYETATVGSASYPNDSVDFDTLFSRIDKALYRGKSKGRNCFIIYVASKHEGLEIPALARRSLYDTIKAMAEGFDGADGRILKLHLAFLPVRSNLNLDKLYYIDGDGRMTDVDTGEPAAKVGGLEGLAPEGIYALADIGELKEPYASLYAALHDRGLGSALISRVEGASGGYLVLCPEPHTKRLWQDNEYAAAFILTRMLSQYETMMRIKGEHVP